MIKWNIFLSGSGDFTMFHIDFIEIFHEKERKNKKRQRRKDEKYCHSRNNKKQLPVHRLGVHRQLLWLGRKTGLGLSFLEGQLKEQP